MSKADPSNLTPDQSALLEADRAPLHSCVVADGVATPSKPRLNQGHSPQTPLKKWQFVRSSSH